MSILVVPSRHLSGMDVLPRNHPWTLGATSRPKARWSFGGMGQDGSSDNPFGSLFGSSSSVDTSGLLNPSSPIDVTDFGSGSTGGGFDFGTIGSSGGCAAGYVVGDSAGNCVPSGSGGIFGSSSGSGSWANTLATLFGTAGKVATVAIAPAGSVIGANGSVTLAPSAAQISATISSYMPLILMGGGLLLVLSLAGKGKN